MAQIVNTVVDSLDVRISRNLRPSRLTREIFDIYRSEIRGSPPDERGRHYVDLPHLGRFEVGYSTNPYELVLKNPEICYIRIANIDNWHRFLELEIGQLYISFRSIFMQMMPHDVIIRAVESIENALFYKGVPFDNIIKPRFLERLDEKGRCRPVFAAIPQNTKRFRCLILELRHQCQRRLLFGIPRLLERSDIIEFDRVSRMDPAADIASRRALRNSDLDQFVCRSRSDEVIYSYSDLSKKQIDDLIEEKAEKCSTPLGGICSNNPPANLQVSECNRPYSDGCAEIFRVPDVSFVERALAPYLSSLVQLGRESGVSKNAPMRVNRIHSRSRKPQTVYFGRFNSQVFAKIYNKLSTLLMQNKEYMMPIWLDNGWLPEVYPEVFRVEVSVSGDFLKRIKVDGEVIDCRSVKDALAAAPMIWRYFSRDWLRQVDGVIDGKGGRNKNSARMKTTSYWKVLQSAFGSGLEMSRFSGKGRILYKNRTDLNKKIHNLIQQATGCMVTAAGIMKYTHINLRDEDLVDEGVPTNEILASVVMSEVFYEWGDIDIDARADRVGLDPVTDMSLSTMSRAQMMDDEDSS